MLALASSAPTSEEGMAAMAVASQLVHEEQVTKNEEQSVQQKKDDAAKKESKQKWEARHDIDKLIWEE